MLLYSGHSHASVIVALNLLTACACSAPSSETGDVGGKGSNFNGVNGGALGNASGSTNSNTLLPIGSRSIGGMIGGTSGSLMGSGGAMIHFTSGGDGVGGIGGTSFINSLKGSGGKNSTSSQSSLIGTASPLSSLKIEANPKNVLSCFVSWKTVEAADSVVQFGTSTYDWEISDSKLVTEHRVLLIGMHAAQSYKIKAISKSESGIANVEGTFSTAALPSSIPVAKITFVDKEKMQPGWTLMNIQKGDGTSTARSNTPAQAVIYDEEGQPVWYYIDGTTGDRGGAIPVELTEKGVFLGAVMDANGATKEPPREVDFSGNTIWECSTPTCGGTGTLTHHANKLSNGHYLIQRDVTVSNMTAPVFEEITSEGKVVWALDYRKLVLPPSGATGDWCHGNSITVNIDKDEVYANCRFVGLIKTTYNNPTLKWHMAASYGAKDLGTIKYSPTTSQYSDTHDPEIHDDGTILFFDNGGWSGVVGEVGNPRGYHSRVVEYKIDETNKTATVVWEFPGSFKVDAWYTTLFYLPFWGDADRLPNGNVLVTAGVRGATAQSRIFEVTKQDGKVVWEFQLPTDFGVYRSERIPTPPLVRAITK
jgi:hypothetical protein